MSGSNSMINLGNIGELSKPVTVLIEKISDAIGGIARPYQIKRIAQAEAEADRIKAVSQIEITELQRRAMIRFVAEEAKKQANMEAITEKAIPEIRDDAPTENVEEDWLANFFAQCRLISDDEMQELWAKVLAGEANTPGQFSKRTISLLSSLDKGDATLFQNLCSFGWVIGGRFLPLVYDCQEKIYEEQGLNFERLNHLDTIGLISFDSIGGFKQTEFPQEAVISYYESQFSIELGNPGSNNELEVGQVILTQVGFQLSLVCRSVLISGFADYIVDLLRSQGCKVEPLDAVQCNEPSQRKP